jgi:hypothetical protein
MCALDTLSLQPFHLSGQVVAHQIKLMPVVYFDRMIMRLPPFPIIDDGAPDV